MNFHEGAGRVNKWECLSHDIDEGTKEDPS